VWVSTWILASRQSTIAPSIQIFPSRSAIDMAVLQDAVESEFYRARSLQRGEPLLTGRYIENPVTRGDRVPAPSRRIHSSRIGTPSGDAAIGHHLS
jgi:hypothetical protein